MDNTNLENSGEEAEVKTKLKSKSSKKSALDFKNIHNKFGWQV
jgi:hypothetical protein